MARSKIWVIPLYSNFDPADRVLGLQFNFPLFLRSERARLREFELQNELIQYRQQNFELEILNKLSANAVNLDVLNSNLTLWESAILNYRKLLDAEREKFILGESTNFLVNRREIQWLQAQQNYIKAYVEYRIQRLEYYYLLATLPEFMELM